MTATGVYDFHPAEHRAELSAIVEACYEVGDELDARTLQRILRKNLKDGRDFFTKSEVIQGYRFLRREAGHDPRVEGPLVERLRMKPVRTSSGVAPVTVLTKPFPCPGKCIFCPSDVRMPKSYLADEPGAQRAGEHAFDPFRQVMSRLWTYHQIGHPIDKIELIILGGTWSSYDLDYRRWFVLRLFEALNSFRPGELVPLGPLPESAPDWGRVEEAVIPLEGSRSYNEVIVDARARKETRSAHEVAEWSELEAAHLENEKAFARCVGLVAETRPDHIDSAEVLSLRRLGVTKVQLGVQSLDDEVLKANHRGHNSAATRRAVHLLRQAGFKLHLHWMPNLHGSTPERDSIDFRRLFEDPALRPDEVKIYPCSLIESAELMHYWRAGRWRPYEAAELLEVLVSCIRDTPGYCRLSRIIRDIPGTDIVTGNKETNFRQRVEAEVVSRGIRSREIRSREVRHDSVDCEQLRMEQLRYGSSVGDEFFLRFVDPQGQLAGFLRLTLPRDRGESEFREEMGAPEEVQGEGLLREVHVYGHLVGLGGRQEGGAQHIGLGRRLIAAAGAIARRRGFSQLAVISAVGTREYYRCLGFSDGVLYQHLSLSEEPRGV